MAQPYDKLQKTFKTVAAQPDIPKLSNPEFDFSVFKINGLPVLYVKHKNPVKGVCVFVAGGGMPKYPKPSQAKGMITYAQKLGRDMILPYYPLCHGHNLYDVYDMMYELYKELLTKYPAEEIAFLGGSSGGNHTLGLISHINAKGEKLPMPGKVYVSSPGTMLYGDEEMQKAEQLDKTDLVMSRKAIGEGLYHCYSTMPFVPEAKQGYENMIQYLRIS